MSTSPINATAHFTMACVGVCKASHLPTAAVAAWLSQPPVVAVLLAIYVVLIAVDLFRVGRALARWIAPILRRARRGRLTDPKERVEIRARLVAWRKARRNH